MRILFVAAEASPLAKVGGMGDVVGTLPKALRAMGHDVRVLMPYYGFMGEKIDIPEEPIWWGYAMFNTFAVYETTLPKSDVPLYLFGHPAFDGNENLRHRRRRLALYLFCQRCSRILLESLETRHYSLPRLAHGHAPGMDASVS